MRTLLRELRSILEHERALHGPYLAIDEPAAPSPDDEPAPHVEPSDNAPDTDDASVGTSSAAPGPSPDADAPPPDAEPAGPADADDSPPTDDSSAPADEFPPPDMPNEDLSGNPTRPPENDPTLPPWERVEALVPDDAPFKDATSLDEVEEYLADNVLVPIDEDRENPVFGVGDPEADLVIIGEAPGRNEDEEGEPFVGRAGKLLDKILDAINFTRDEVYITNILKSRPPRNRNPKEAEVDAHLPILHKQIALIRPKIILTVGKVAGNTLLDRSSSLSNLREKEHDFYGFPLMATYHPAALLRNSQWKRPTWEDVKLLRTRYDQLTDEDD